MVLVLAACTGRAPSAPPDAARLPMSPAVPGQLTEAGFAALHRPPEGSAPPLHGSEVPLGDGEGYLSLPAGATAPMPGIVVVHEWWGLNDHVRHWADRLAAEGYAALAVDLYGGGVATDRDGAMALVKAVDEVDALATLRRAHAFLATDPRVKAERTAVIGWCFGGGWALRLGLSEPELDAVVVYYGHLEHDPAALAPLAAPVLGIFGTRDAGIPVDAVRAFEAAAKRAGKEVAVHLYDAEHAFANPSNPQYDAVSAEHAWEQVRAFLAARLRG